MRQQQQPRPYWSSKMPRSLSTLGRNVIRDNSVARKFHVSRDDDVAECAIIGRTILVKVRNLTDIAFTARATQLVVVCASDRGKRSHVATHPRKSRAHLRVPELEDLERTWDGQFRHACWRLQFVDAQEPAWLWNHQQLHVELCEEAALLR